MNVRFVLVSVALAFGLAFGVSLVGWLDSGWFSVGIFGAIIAGVAAIIDLFGYHKRYLLLVFGLMAFALVMLAPGLETSVPIIYNITWAIAIALVATFAGALVFARPGRPPANLRHGH